MTTETNRPAPVTWQDHETEREALTGEILDIQLQLGRRNATDATDADGRRWSEQEWWDWRVGATYALRAKVRRLSEVETWLREHVNERPRQYPPGHGAVDRELRMLYRSATRVVRADVPGADDDRWYGLWYGLLQDLADHVRAVDAAMALQDGAK